MTFALEKCCNSLKNLPLLKCLCFTPNDQYVALKIAFRFIVGFILGILLYRYILSELGFTDEIAFYLALSISTILGIGLATSSQIRCMTLLALTSLGGRIGRSVLKALVITLVISGPLENLSNNGKEVVRVFSCTASLQFNLTKARFSLMFKPFAQAIFGIKTEIYEVKDTIRSIKDVSAPVAGEIENEQVERAIKEENDYLDNDKTNEKKDNLTESREYEKMYLKKVEMRCMDQFTKASIKCRAMFQKGYDTCYETVSWIAAWILCWPMKLDFVCNVAEALGGASRCDPSKHIDAGFGEGYAYLKQSRVSLTQNFKDVKLQYKIGKIKQLRDLRDARDTASAILHNVKNKKAFFDTISNIIKRLLVLVFIRVIFSSQTYEEKFLKDIEFDNCYISKYFRKIDARRKSQEKSSLLPLKKLERKQLIDPFSPKPLKSERELILKESFLLLLEMITASTFILLDSLFFEALDIIRRHARIDYLTTGKHDLVLTIKGTGMIATLLRSLIKGFNIKKRIKVERSNEKCLPRPQKLSKSYIWKIYGTYFAIWLMMWFQAYFLRMRRMICAYFFKKREKKRILFLYNETLKRRKTFLKFMRRNVERKARSRRLEENYNIFQIMSAKNQGKCKWLRIFKCARRKCLICDETEPRKRSKFIECSNEHCYFIYCEECWKDMGNECLACTSEEMPDIDTTEEDDEDEEIIDEN
ncbi:unnamed protein product [Ceutorhynchus assimilis]|uniref:Dendritic cell-specific transmembrane protein-like domain-containing protein n=1 Tax=Ceutorhynchus assimilis TaxID=467358 RepID=A0A9N9MXF2_9CUCU|nr:unnamed protein product [Ceutorhynchus assimilis]